MAKQKKIAAERSVTWNNGMLADLEAKIAKLTASETMHRAAKRGDSGFIRATAEIVYDELHALADRIDEE